MTQEKNELKDFFTQHWNYLAVRAACQLGLFDRIAEKTHTPESLVQETGFNPLALKALLSVLLDLEMLAWQNKTIHLTQKGLLLTEKHPESLKQACILWGGEHLSAWQNLIYTIKTGQSAFKKRFQQNFFQHIQNKPATEKNYHQAMAEYARDDYKNLPETIDFSAFQTIADIGGGTGTLLKHIAEKHPEKELILFELPSVLKLFDSETTQIQKIPGNFFKKMPFKAGAIVLARILHDWDDTKARRILKNCYAALNPKGKVFVAEILHDRIQANLLSLNMLAVCQSKERSLEQYKKLLEEAGFALLSIKRLNQVQHILEAQKR